MVKCFWNTSFMSSYQLIGSKIIVYREDCIKTWFCRYYLVCFIFLSTNNGNAKLLVDVCWWYPWETNRKVAASWISVFPILGTTCLLIITSSWSRVAQTRNRTWSQKKNNVGSCELSAVNRSFNRKERLMAPDSKQFNSKRQADPHNKELREIVEFAHRICTLHTSMRWFKLF